MRVEVADGSISDEGTYVVTMNWSVVVNNFPSSCNNMDTYSLSNTTCVYAGIANLGSEVDITSLPTSVYLRPSAIAYTPAGNMFIADETHDVVFFWNRATSPEIALWGLTIPQNTIRVVAGHGARCWHYQLCINPGNEAAPQRSPWSLVGRQFFKALH